jgi:SAM-dependent methyltransferase
MAAVAIKPDYGLDAPGIVRSMFVRAGWLLAFAILIWYCNRSNAPDHANAILNALGWPGLAFLIVGAVMIWSSRVAKMGVRDRMLDSIAWRGDESVLDVGCGRGLLAIGAAKRLTKSGKVTGVDLWNDDDLSGNTPDALRDNAKAEGVEGRIKLENTDARTLPFPNDSFDVVLSSLAIHNIEGADERAKAIAEIVRVLKPAGRVIIFDIGRAPEYAKELQRLGMTDVQLSSTGLLWMLPSRSVSARKP